MLQFIKNLFYRFNKLHYIFNQTPYSLEDIDAELNRVTILCRGSRAYIRTSIEATIGTPNIVKGLSPMHACWLGYYYAYLTKITPKKILSQIEEFSFTSQIKQGRFKILSLETRTSILTFCDLKSDKIYKEKITHVAQDEFVINNIDPTQACYIGMQAGYKFFRKPSEALDESTNHPVLKLVK